MQVVPRVSGKKGLGLKTRIIKSRLNGDLESPARVFPEANAVLMGYLHERIAAVHRTIESYKKKT